MPAAKERLLFVTGKLAESALRDTVEPLAAAVGFEYEIVTLKISVAALMTPQWVARQLPDIKNIDRVILPGWCQGNLAIIQQRVGTSVTLGPKDLRSLPEFFDQKLESLPGYGAYSLEIIAEINHAPSLSMDAILSRALDARTSGADIIDLGCTPGHTWTNIKDCTKRLCQEGFRVSVDSFNPLEVQRAVQAGAELVLSVHAGKNGNLELARDLECEVVVIPATPSDWESLELAVEKLTFWNAPFRIDPVLEPIGFGFARSLERYLKCRHQWPDFSLMMGVGNLSELTDVDSAGINVLLAGFCQETNIQSILTTEVINWARSSVKEWDLARRLVYFACENKVLPKHLEPQLHLLRDTPLQNHGLPLLKELSKKITDKNFRIFSEEGVIHVMNDRGYHQGTDPFAMFQKLMSENTIDPHHAFYLGFEMAKAITALTLHKNYRQDQPLQWGFLTREEAEHHPFETE